MRGTLRLSLIAALIQALVFAPVSAAVVQVPVRMQPVGGALGLAGAAAFGAAGTSAGQDAQVPGLSSILPSDLPPAGPAVVLKDDQLAAIKNTVAEDPAAKVMEPRFFDIIMRGDPQQMDAVARELAKRPAAARGMLFAMYNGLSRLVNEAPLKERERMSAAMAYARRNAFFLQKLLRRRDIGGKQKARFKAALELLNKDTLVFEELANQRMLQGRIAAMDREYFPPKSSRSSQVQGRSKTGGTKVQPGWKLREPIPREKRLRGGDSRYEQSAVYSEVKESVEKLEFDLEKHSRRALLASRGESFSEEFKHRWAEALQSRLEAAKKKLAYLRHITNRIASVSLRRLFMGEARNHKIVWIPKNKHLNLVPEKGGFALVADFQTDITDDKALAFIKASIEDYWRGYFEFQGEKKHFRTLVRIQKLEPGTPFPKGALKLQGGTGRVSHGGPDGIYLEMDLDYATPAHEFGHVLGLADDYQEGYDRSERKAWSVQNEGSLMGSLNGSVLPGQFRLVYQLLRRHRLYSPRNPAGASKDGVKTPSGDNGRTTAGRAARTPPSQAAAGDEDAVAAYLQGGPKAPGLGDVEMAALSLFRVMMPEFYKAVPFTARYDESARPQTGHMWSKESGHIIELAKDHPDVRGEVASSFGMPGLTRVQEKVEQLLQFAHEYAHVIFDEAVRKAADHSILSAFSPMTEGFAVAVEQLIIERTLKDPESLGLSERDAEDFSAIAKARWHWLSNTDTHYAEGIRSWRTAFKNEDIAGMAAFLSALSAQRMIETPRSDPAYQLAVGDPALLSAYLGKDADAPLRRGLEAFRKIAAGEKVSGEEEKAAAAAAQAAGPEGRQRVFFRSLIDDMRVPDPGETRGAWFKGKDPVPVRVAPAFALAKLRAEAASELAAFLVQFIRTQEGARRLFGTPGPSPKLNALIQGADSLPFTPEQRRVWDQALNSWLLSA